MALIPTQSLDVDLGTAPTLDLADAADTAQVGGNLVLVVVNDDAAAVTLTIKYPGTLVTGDEIPDKEYTIAASGGRAWIPLLDVYADPATDRQAVLTWSATANVTRAVVAV